MGSIMEKIRVSAFIYLSKTFDYVTHILMVAILKHYIFSSVDKNKIEKYLLNSKHIVSWDEE